ncbi:MAG: metallophosphoesterase, partial [bacterium]
MKRSLTTGLIVLTLFLLITDSGCQRSQPPITLTVLHWNDFHSHNLPFSAVLHGDTVNVGGAAHLAALIDSLRLLSPNPVVLHAGDEFMGTPISTITKGKSQIEVLNLFQLDAFALGNHEFDYGWETLKTRLAEAEFPVLCANVYDETTGKPIALTSIILKRSGVRIGIIGVNTRHLDSVVLEESL